MRALVLITGLLLAGTFPAAAQNSDPPSKTIDPLPAALDWVESLAPGQWVFGALLWNNGDPCNEQSCQAAYNASTVSVLVWRENYCCGHAGYSLEFDASVKGCAARSYYLVSSKDIDGMSKTDRAAFLERHVYGVVSATVSACKVAKPGVIPMSVIIERFG